MPANGPEIIKRYDRLVSEHANDRQLYEAMAPFIAPSRIDSANNPNPSSNVFDSTGLMAAELCSHFIAGSVINQAQLWFNLKMQSRTAQRIDALREWNEERRDIAMSYLAGCNFYAEAAESLIDWVGFGTNWLMREERERVPYGPPQSGFRGFNFKAEKIGTFIVQEGVNGLVDTGFREFHLTTRVAVDRWGEGGKNLSKFPEKIKNAYNEGKLDQVFKFIHAIYPRKKAEQGNYGGIGMPFASCWVEYESKTVVHESGYRKFPAIVSRYQRTPGSSPYGRGRGHIAFPDTWTLNSAKQMGLEDWALKIRPPMLHAQNSVFGTLRLVPGAPTAVNTMGRPLRDVIAPYETGSRPEISQIKEEELRKSIRQIFYIDHILMLMEVSKSEMTAFEFAKKLELLYKLMGPVYGRLAWEFLYQLIDGVVDDLEHARLMPPPPPEINETDGVTIAEFSNPLEKAQKAGDAESLLLAINDLTPLASIPGNESMLDWINKDKTAIGIFEMRGVPALWLNNQREVDELRQARQELQEEQKQNEEMAQMAESGGKIAPLLKEIKTIPGPTQQVA